MKSVSAFGNPIFSGSTEWFRTALQKMRKSHSFRECAADRERLRADITRLAMTSPHLLADIGLEPDRNRGSDACTGAELRVERTAPAAGIEVILEVEGEWPTAAGR